MSALRRPVRLLQPDQNGIDQDTIEFPEIKIIARPQETALEVPAPAVPQAIADHVWHLDSNRQRAAKHLQRLEKAMDSAKSGTAERARMAFLATVHSDRIARARTVAREHGLKFERAGRGPLLDHPVLHQQRRLDWRIYPLEAYHGIELPERARRVMRTWEAEAGIFDRYYLADEVAADTAQTTERLVSLRTARGTSRVAAEAAREASGAAAKIAGGVLSGVGRVAAALVTAPARGTAVTSMALVRPDPCLIGVVSADGVNGDWFILARWRH